MDCVYGNPFRPPSIAPGWRTPTVLTLAEGVYADRGFDRLPVLADALEDAGCADADLLAHCRGGGPHVRGCWAIDRLLDKPRRAGYGTSGVDDRQPVQRPEFGPGVSVRLQPGADAGGGHRKISGWACARVYPRRRANIVGVAPDRLLSLLATLRDVAGRADGR